MLIEYLIRLGRPLLEGDVPPGVIIKQVSDVAAVNAKGFLSRVFVIEVYQEGEHSRIAALPVQCWGEYQLASTDDKNETFTPDVSRAVGAPFVLPLGGNPTKPQGCYGVPAYLVYENQIKKFIKSSEAIESFLAGRLSRTIGLKLTDDQIKTAAVELHKVAQDISTDSKDKLLGLVVIAVIEEGGPYQLSDEIPVGSSKKAYIGPSVLNSGKFIVADLEQIKKRFWEAKLAEGAEKGALKGEAAECDFCGIKGEVVSTYCKAWPWFTTTWNCPLPINIKDKQLVETSAICPQCYYALTYGANLFNKLSRPLEYWLTKEIFSPVSTVSGKKNAKAGTPDSIYGCAYALPVLDNFLEDKDDRDEFVSGMLGMLDERSYRGDKLDIHLQEIIGFEMNLPENIASDSYRLTVIYYSGEVSRGDIHLRVTIEDVVPSVIKQLRQVTKQTAAYAVESLTYLYNEVSEKHKSYIKQCYSSLPYLLNNSYGAPYIWQLLSTVLHRGPISRRRFLRNVSQRMNEASRSLPDISALTSEVIFYLSFTKFLKLYNQLVALEPKRGGVTMRDWQELKVLLTQGNVNDIKFSDSEELGFAAGYLIRIFSRQYWHASGEKDFIKHRVMTFGSSLTPETIWKRALSRVNEYALKLDMHISDDLRQRFAVVLMEYSRMREQVNKEKDAFMAAFWAGYALSGDKKAEQVNKEV